MLEHLTGITLVALRIKTLRAKKIRNLFGKNGVGIDKIKYVTCSANEILKLTNAQIQNVIDQVSLKLFPWKTIRITCLQKSPIVIKLMHIQSLR